MITDAYERLRKMSPRVTGGLIRMREASFEEGVVPAKYKILAALSIVVATKCEPCIKGYAQMAYKAGVTVKELVEFLNVAITESGCPGEQWALTALNAYDAIKAGKDSNTVEICCHEETVN